MNYVVNVKRNNTKKFILFMINIIFHLGFNFILQKIESIGGCMIKTHKTDLVHIRFVRFVTFCIPKAVISDTSNAGHEIHRFSWRQLSHLSMRLVLLILIDYCSLPPLKY